MKSNGILFKSLKAHEDQMRAERNSLRLFKPLINQIDDSLLPEGSRVSVNSSNVYIYIPWGIESLKKLRQAIGPKWKYSSKYDSSTGTMTRYYNQKVDNPNYDPINDFSWDKHINFQLCVTMDADLAPDGACKKILVEEKEEIVVRKVYKIVCPDGIETLETEIAD